MTPPVDVEYVVGDKPPLPPSRVVWSGTDIALVHAGEWTRVCVRKLAGLCACEAVDQHWVPPFLFTFGQTLEPVCRRYVSGVVSSDESIWPPAWVRARAANGLWVSGSLDGYDPVSSTVYELKCSYFKLPDAPKESHVAQVTWYSWLVGARRVVIGYLCCGRTNVFVDGEPAPRVAEYLSAAAEMTEAIAELCEVWGVPIEA